MAGNNNSGKRKDKLGYDALMLEMKAAEDTRGMRVLARKLLDLAISGDLAAIKEVFNRIDGMPVQQVDQTVEHINYVAELPPVAPDTPSWLRQTAPKSSIQ